MSSPRKTKKELSLFGERLRQLRHERRLILGELAKATGVSIAQLSAIETGRTSIENALAKKIADFLELSGETRDDFLLAADDSRLATVIEAQDLLGRRIAGMLARKINEWPQERLALMYRICKQPERRIAERLLDYWVPPLSAHQIDLVAQDIRFRLGINSSQTILDVVEFILPEMLECFEWEIVPIAEAAHYYAHTALYPLQDREKTTVVMLRIREDVYEDACRGNDRAVWTIAHELGHIFLNHIRTVREVDDRIADTLVNMKAYFSCEWQAEAFAASFLMPREECWQRSPYEIFLRFRVSPETARKRKASLTKRALGEQKGRPIPEQLLKIGSRNPREESLH
jgi:Zn-dependent peptidase ImmA (M78 family)/DNA-binding XRE family transcriptional regulator